MDTTSLIITGLTPNTGYIINVTASTMNGMGDVATAMGMTEEDGEYIHTHTHTHTILYMCIHEHIRTAPQAITNLSLISELSLPNPNAVRVTISWDGPSTRNGSYNYNLNFSASQSPPYPPERRRNNSSQLVLSGDQLHVDYIIEEGLPFAVYNAEVTAVNIETGREGPNTMMNWRTTAICELWREIILFVCVQTFLKPFGLTISLTHDIHPYTYTHTRIHGITCTLTHSLLFSYPPPPPPSSAPSPVTSLTTVASSPESIFVSWDFPDYPNGPITQYNVYYRQSNTVSSPPIISSEYQLLTAPGMRRNINITGLIAFTHYVVFVQAVGRGAEGDLLGVVEEERIQRTNATVVMIATPAPGVTEQPTLPPSQTTIDYDLPSVEFDTGPLS